MAEAPDFLAPRGRLREPIPEIFECAELLSLATDAHLAGDRVRAEEMLKRADMPIVRMWTDSLWGSAFNHPEQAAYHRVRKVAQAPPLLPKAERLALRMPSSAEKAALIERYGYNCVFCGIPLIRAEVRRAFTAAYPQDAYWGDTTMACHAGFQCMWLQYDHVLPHSRGGDNSTENLVLTCAGCNYGRMSYTLAEVGLQDPRKLEILKSDWDGLERFLSGGLR